MRGRTPSCWSTSRPTANALSPCRFRATWPSRRCSARPWNPETGEYGPLYDEETDSYGPDEVYTETKLNSAYSFGGPKCLVKVIQKLSGLSVNRFMAVDFAGFSKMVDALGGVEVCSTTPLEDYELGTVLANAGRQMVDGHTALQLRARPAGDHRDQRRLRPDQAPAAVPVVAAALDDLQGSVLLADQAQQRGQHVHRRQLRRQHRHQGPGRPRPVACRASNAGRITFLTVPTVGYADEYGNETPARRRHAGALRRDHQRRPAARGEERRQHAGARHARVDDAARRRTPTRAQPDRAGAPATAELVDAVTTDPTDVTVRVSNSTGEDGLAATAASELQQHGFNVTTPDDYPGPLNSTTVFFSPGNEQAAATVASAFTEPHHRAGQRAWATWCGWCSGSDFYSVTPPSPSGSPVQVHVVHGTSSAPTHLPEDLTVTNAADTTLRIAVTAAPVTRLGRWHSPFVHRCAS